MKYFPPFDDAWILVSVFYAVDAAALYNLKASRVSEGAFFAPKLVKRLEHVPETLINRHSFRFSWSLGINTRRGFSCPIPESLHIQSSVAGLMGIGVLFSLIIFPDVALVTVWNKSKDV